MRWTRRTLVTVASLVAAPALADAHGLEFRQGFHPHCGGTLICTDSDYFKGWGGGFEYDRAIGKTLEAAAGVDYGSWKDVPTW
jgi:hypothetical protein